MWIAELEGYLKKADVATRCVFRCTAVHDMPTQKEAAAIKKVLASPTFLGSPSLLDITVWHATAKGTCKLMLKPETDDAAFVEAPVEWIGEIVADNFNLLPDAGFNDHFEGSLATQKASARVGQPAFPAYAEMWSSLPEAIEHLQESKISSYGKPGNYLLQSNGVRIRHVLFAEVDKVRTLIHRCALVG